MIINEGSTSSKGIFDNLTQILPTDFANVQNPNSPWVSIQFRTNATLEIDNIKGWQEITLNPSNFFDKMSVEDAGGFQTLTLSLVDKEFTRLENLVIASIATVNNVISTNQTVTSFPGTDLPFKLDKESLINLKVRFGYSETSLANGEKSFIDETALAEDTFVNRVDVEKTVIRSPWLYFMINDVNFQLNDFGLLVEIKAFSTTSVLLDRAKMMKAFAIYRNIPKEFFHWVSNIFEQVTGLAGKPKKLTVNWDDKPIGPLDTKGNLAEVTIELGTNAVIDLAHPSFISIREMLNIFCGKMTPKTFKGSGEAIEGTDISAMEMTSSYSYVYKEGKDNEPDQLIFHYPQPGRAEGQKKLRVYIWREYGRSIVKNFSVSTNTNLAAINSPIPINDITTGNLNIVKGKTKVIEYLNEVAKTDPQKMAQGFVNDVETKLDDWRKIANGPDDYSLISNSIGRSTELDIKDASHPMVAGIVSAINDQVFNGTLTIFGDPFYFFDDRLRPMEYAVKVVLMRPAYTNEQGIYTGSNQNLQTSYLSGHYLLKKITHTIDINGYTTDLEVMRSPLE